MPNTGRCKELLVEDAVVYLRPSDNPNRKTKYSLYYVENNGALVAMFSQEANKIVFDAINKNKVKELSNYSIIESEKTIGSSRIDIYLANHKSNFKDNADSKSIGEDSKEDIIDETYVEVKSVTLIKDGVAQFPDAPTDRGRKHLEELISLKKEGIRAVVFFLVEHPNGNSFRPNWENDPKFSETLVKAYDEGVEILVYKTRNDFEGIELVGDCLDFNLNK
ncbi:sugar fermentation stimulation protein SfsA2 [Methanobrevibacter ruminantium M1]|uniref:Sugar fermentation stimulation protein homolog n=1 Tax=Methanobrevibacter ruminantium (strain ATCC 35063 / DSM 1093 / JCM 13430 / OCM 146 / M1) TaxID=634498 RepID=D3E0E4_METRM|nr:sugar fermentation stimulation protein SfsA2 [Methanobrevibacter ruminantium M1]